jgi:hypothetical protein
MKRIPTRELLDTDEGTPSEIAASFSDLRMFNRWFGGISCSTRLVDRVLQHANSTALSWLDVAAGAGYVPVTIQTRFAQRNVRLDITLLDHAASHVRNGNRAIVGDALALPFRDNSFDFVSSELFVHHLAPEQVVQFAREGLRISRHAFLINDLIRNPIHLALAYAGFPLYRSRITRNDAPASVQQAYTVKEMRDLLVESGAASIEITTGFLYRMGIIVWKENR